MSAHSPIAAGPLCDAIRERALVAFDYDGLARVVAPYCHGRSAAGAEVLRAVQVRGASRSGPLRSRSGKLWLVGKLVGVRVLDERFVPDDPLYNPDDRAMAEIHCRI